jgi:hypothetical protein
MFMRTVGFWARVLLLTAAVLGIPLVVWSLAKAQATRIDTVGPLTWSYFASAPVCAVLMFFATKRWKRQHLRLLAGVVAFTPLASACVAALIAAAAGNLVPLNALNFPFFGMSLGWQLGGGLGLGEQRPQ